VKLLFDENLSRKLVSRLVDLYPGSMHVSEAGLVESPDREVWEYAKANVFLIVSTDSDFYELATTIGPPPKVIWLRRSTHPTNDAEDLLRRSALRITDFEQDLLNWVF
jgi:predicted nuclease of predicted toxin-antitoxin system